MPLGNRYRALIWDFDGTVMDTYPGIVDAYLKAATQDFSVAVDYTMVWTWAKTRLGVCRRNIADLAGTTPEEVERAFAERYEARDLTAEGFFPGVLDCLRAVVLSGGKNFLVTHRSGRSLRDYLSAHDLSRYFLEAVPMLESFPPKPAPNAFLYLIWKYRLSVDQVLGVGDRGLDIEAAHAAGADGCFFDPAGAVYPPAEYNIAHFRDLEMIL